MTEYPPIAPGLLMERYLVGPPLDKGGMGRLFVAHNIETGERLALKTALTPDPVVAEYFRQELRSLTRLSHPGVVRVHAHGSWNGQPWYVMDLLEGNTLRPLLPAKRGESRSSAPREDRTLPNRSVPQRASSLSRSTEPLLTREDLLRICFDVLATLAHVHARGIVHGDLKPENIFVRPDLKTVLVDFGLTLAFDSPRELVSLWPRGAGSTAYMAPEQIRGKLTDARADLYSFGCVLYECVTGLTPHAKDSVDATKFAHLYAPVVPASRVTENVPPRLDSLINRLLAKQPRDRPGYADEVLDLLRPHVRGVPEAAALPYSVGAQLYRPSLLGRSDELAELRRALPSAAKGDPSTILVCGDSGIGKTRLVTEVLDEAALLGFRVFGLERPLDTAGPFGALKDLLGAVLEWSNATRAVDGPLVSLSWAVQLAAGSLGLSEAPTALDSLLGELATTVRQFTRDNSVLLVLDDLDQLDELTAQFLARLTTAPADGERLLVLATATRVPSLLDRTHVKRVWLAPLSECEIEQLIREMLAEEHLPADLVQDVSEHAEGNPLLLAYQLRMLVDSGSLSRIPHRGWHFKGQSGGDALRTETVSAVFHRKIASLEPQQLSFASRAAVVGREFSSEVVASILAIRDEEAIERASALCDGHVLVASGSRRYRFVNRTLQALLAQQVPAEALRKLQRRAARFLALVHKDDPAAAHMIAMHFSRSGNRKRAIAYYESAARYFTNTYQIAAAKRSLQAALTELEEDDTVADDVNVIRGRLLEALGDSALVARHLDEATACFGKALAIHGAPQDCARLRRKLASASQRDQTAAAELLRDAIQAIESAGLGTEHPEWIQAHIDLMFIHYWRQETPALFEIASKLAQFVERSGSPAQRADFYFASAAGMMLKRRYRTTNAELEKVDRALALYESLHNGGKVAMSHFLRAMILFCSDQFELARVQLEKLLAVGERTASVTIQVRAIVYLGLVHRRFRSVEEVRRLSRAALALAERAGMREYQGTSLANLSWVALRDGHLEDCERLAVAACAHWDGAPLVCAFRWVALLPLMAVKAASPAARQSAEELLTIAAALLHGTQCELPELLRADLQALAMARSECSSSVDSLARAVIRSATECGML